MATIKDINVIYTEMELKNYNMYVVQDSDNKSTLTAQHDKNVSAAEAVKMLKEFLEKLDGIVYITIRNKTNTDMGAGGDLKNTLFKYCVRLGDFPGSLNNPNEGSKIENTGAIGAAIAKAEENFNLKFENLKNELLHKNEVDKLKEEIKELKEGDPIQNKGLEILAQLIAGNLNGAGGAINGINAPSPGGIGNVGLDPLTRVKNALKDISRVDKDYIEHLEMIAKLAINNPMKYKIAISKLEEL